MTAGGRPPGLSAGMSEAAARASMQPLSRKRRAAIHDKVLKRDVAGEIDARNMTRLRSPRSSDLSERSSQFEGLRSAQRSLASRRLPKRHMERCMAVSVEPGETRLQRTQ